MNNTYIVDGMTCQHCVASVTEEISEIDGVDSVEVDLASGTVVVGSAFALAAGSVESAVAEAGYKLVSSVG